MFDVYNKWIQNLTLSGTWATADNAAAVDERLRSFYDEKTFDRSFQHKTDSDINTAVADFINSHVYELDKLYETTQAVYDPIQNYSMTESGTDENHSRSSGDTTEYATSYNSSTENKTGKSTAGGSSDSTFTHNFTRSGNIGVTTSQQMLQSERDLAHFDFIGYVAEMIVTNFTSAEYFPCEDLMAVIL